MCSQFQGPNIIIHVRCCFLFLYVGSRILPYAPYHYCTVCIKSMCKKLQISLLAVRTWMVDLELCQEGSLMLDKVCLTLTSPENLLCGISECNWNLIYCFQRMLYQGIRIGKLVMECSRLFFSKEYYCIFLHVI